MRLDRERENTGNLKINFEWKIDLALICLQHPVGRMVNDLVQNHHQTYGCGTKTLLMTLDLLAAAASSLRDKVKAYRLLSGHP